MPDDNKTLIRRFYDAFNGDPAFVLDQYVADQALKEHSAMMQRAFPGYQIRAEDMVAEVDRVVVRFTVHAKHEGPLFGIPATGNEVTVPGLIIYRIHGGKIVEHWMQVDMRGLMQQLGAAPAAPSA